MHDTGKIETDRPVARAERLAWRPVLAVVAVAGVVHLAVAARFGWHRDEFYYVVSGRHLAWGYPDQPPLTPLLARLAADLPGGVLPLRLLAIAAQLGCVLLAAKLAAEFGGRSRAQTITAAAIAACPVFVAGSMLFGTTVTDQLAWAAVFVAVARALRSGTVRAWLLAGAVTGIGLENKYTVGVLLLGVVVGLALFRRTVLRTPGPWLAGALAAVLVAPNVVWNAQHSWAQFRMAGVLSAEQGGPLGALPNVPLLLLVLAGPPLIALWIFGVRWLAGNRDHRWVLVVAVTAVVVFTAGGGKSYYAAPALIGLFAAGGVWAETRYAVTPRRWRIAIVLSGVFAVLIGLPVLPVSAERVFASVNPQLVETYGWPDVVRQVTAVADTLPPGSSVFTSNYGEAGALTLLGPDAGLQLPVSSAHNGYLLWGSPAGTPDTVLCVGEWGPDYLRRFWSDVREIAPITTPGGVANEETTNHAAIYLCRQPHGTWAQLWPGLSHLD
ncbi:glycosyltransferase family 39 protein [Amycolatopsis sp. DSM 110486]|uniref:glycosyltransferase family 39 protein n=1 Tax=Amycolatopsis sp. DSM 110486 TaxID=2865832 RepID=UPI001C69CD79|nr:glycosyltransferase family 39 protein [Amycolatopsis sp. DSM 110486]QYN20850.1 glycosyltransferase family 39 protein [Amycolatopsis sp. DSM 110486]